MSRAGLLKRIERGWKSFWFPAADRMLQRRAANAAFELDRGPRRILYLRHDRIGDAIVSSPLLDALVALGPQVRVDVLCSSRNFELLRRYPSITQIHLYEKGRPFRLLRLAVRLWRTRYDVVIDPIITARSFTSLLIMLASRASYTLGFADCGLLGITNPVGGNSKADHVMDLLARFLPPLGGEAATLASRPALPVTDEELEWGRQRWGARAANAPKVLINVSGGHQTRDWPDERFVEVVAALKENDPEVRVVIVGAPFAAERVRSIATAAAVASAETPQLGMLIGLVASADMVFTPDTSVAHIASSYDVPAVAMYLDGTARQWGMRGSAMTNLESPTTFLRDLPVTRVLPAVLATFERVRERVDAGVTRVAKT